MRRHTVLTAFVGAACLLLAGRAKADTIGSLSLPGCDTNPGGCPAATYSFDITTTSATLTINVTGVPDSTNGYIDAVNLGFAPSSAISGLTLASAPSSGWTPTTGSLNSGGSCGANSGAFACASASPLNSLPMSQGGSYTWTWNFNATPASSIFSADDVHIGAEYGPNNGSWNGLIVSETISQAVPEPSSLAFLGAALIGLIGFSLKQTIRAWQR